MKPENIPAGWLQRSVSLVRVTLMLPFLAAVTRSGSAETRFTLCVLALVFVFSTYQATLQAQRDDLTRQRITILSILDFVLLVTATLVASPSTLFALPAYSLLSFLQALLGGKRGALVGGLLALVAAVPLAVLRLEPWSNPSETEWLLLTLWAVQNTATVALLGVYVEQQGLLLRALEQTGIVWRAEAARHAEMALRDPLTGVYNRRFLGERLDEEVARARRTASPLSLAAIDIDHLKQWNDTHGHATGDAAIRTLANLLRAACRKNDVVCRIGGEEFLLLAPDTSAEGLRILVDRVLEAAAGTAIEGASGGKPHVLTFSAGITTLDNDQDGDALLQTADRILYDAKHAGRNRVLVATPTTTL